jgi:uncharacterized protein (DUF934 family)
MQIIKDKQIMSDAWEFIPDGLEPGNGDIIVSVANLIQNGKALSNLGGKLGVRMTPDDSVAVIAEYLPELALVELYFSDFADGRLFSHAWLLRDRYHFAGEIRAKGHFLPDQVFYLSRVGVDSFSPENTEALSTTLACLKDFSVHYQPSVN